jgi:hypothetical protein
VHGNLNSQQVFTADEIERRRRHLMKALSVFDAMLARMT